MARDSYGNSYGTTARWVELLERASSAAAAFRSARAGSYGPRTTAERMELEHRQAAQRHDRAVRRYRKTLQRLRNRAKVATATSATAGTVAVVDLASATVLDGWFVVAAPVAVVSGWYAHRKFRRASRLVPPEPPSDPPPPPRPLPPGAVGSPESEHLNRIRIQIAQLLPTVAAVHRDAARELRAADSAAAVPLGGLVERLDALHRVTIEMSGTEAASTARRVAEEVRARLAEGVAMYSELLSAAVALLSAPDPDSEPSNRLRSAVLELSAYGEGLRRAGAITELPDS